jgi:NADH dehydrogenase
LGAGYGGLYTALKLENFLKKRKDHQILLIDRNEYHQLKTELHEVAAAKKSSEATTIPIKTLLKHKRIGFLKAEITNIDFPQKTVITTDNEVKYDKLVIALGSQTEFFGIPEMEKHAFTLTSIKDAHHLKEHIRKMFIQATKIKDENAKQAKLTFVIGGGGFTGVELATELADYLIRLSKKQGISQKEPRLLIVEAGSRILPGFDIKLANKALRIIKSKSIKLMLKTPVVAFDGNIIQLKTNQKILTETLIWTGGVRANALLARSGLKCGPRGRAAVNPFLESVDYAGVYLVGDNSLVLDTTTGRPLAPTAQLALQEAETVAYNIYAELTGKRRRRFKPKIVGQFVSLGRHQAVGWIWRFRVSGVLAWLLKRLSVFRYLNLIGGPRLMITKLLPLLFR